MNALPESQSNDRVVFETPENVQVSYAIAGLGTRFIAWVIDFIIIILIIVALLILAIIGGAASATVERDLERALNVKPGQMPDFPNYIIGVFVAIISLSKFLYFGLCEL